MAQPGQFFRHIGDILVVPELSVASPWLGDSNSLSDDALEAIPSQILPLLRPDSIAAVAPGSGPTQIQFTGLDGYSYAIQVSSDLVNWTSVSTNTPENGGFIFASFAEGNGARFYRSVLGP